MSETQDRAIELCTRTLGFELRGDTPYGEDGRWKEATPPEADTTVALVASHRGRPAGIPTDVGLTT